jgi:hypothetical protein
MTSKTNAVARTRAANKRDRAKRREEILDRWEERRAITLFERAISETHLTSVLVENLLWYGQWTDRKRLLDVANLDSEAMSKIARYLLRVVELKEMAYDEYLQTPEWKTLAETCKKRYDNRCALDANHPADQAHHRTYARRGREHPLDLIPLCADCHGRFHGKIK